MILKLFKFDLYYYNIFSNIYIYLSFFTRPLCKKLEIFSQTEARESYHEETPLSTGLGKLMNMIVMNLWVI